MAESIDISRVRLEPKSIAWLIVGLIVVALAWQFVNNVAVPMLRARVPGVAAATGGGGGPAIVSGL